MVGVSSSAGRTPGGVRFERADPFVGGGAVKPAGLIALDDEVKRAMGELTQVNQTNQARKAEPPPYFIAQSFTCGSA